MLSRRLSAVLLGACGALAVAAGEACSHPYAENVQADGAAPDASTTKDAPDDGAVGNDAPTGDAAKPPAFTELATGLTDLAGIAATEKNVYFTELGPGNVSSVPIAGGAVSTIVTKTGAPGSIVIAGGFVFWADIGAATLNRLAPLDGSMTTAGLAPGKSPRAMAAGANRLVVTAIGGPSGGEVQQYAFDLAPLESVADLANPFDVAVTGTSIYWTEASGARIGTGTIGTAFNKQLATNESGCESIAANAAGVFWTRPEDGLVRTLGTMGAGATTIAAKELAPMSVTADDTGVYWLTGDGLLRRRTFGQELPPATLANGFASTFIDKRIRAIALTSKYVVWITTDGRVLRTDR